MKILVLTETDDCCGPMAVCFMNDFNGGVEVSSAGLFPAEKVNKNAIELMHECFHDLSDYKPVRLERTMLDDAELNIIIGEISMEVPQDKCMRLELPQHLLEPKTMGEMRALIDYLKNEAFVTLKRLLGKNI